MAETPTVVVVDDDVETLPLKHRVGKTVVSTLAGFAAADLSERAYDAVLRRLWARKSS